jgi:hypothetical protein
MSTKALKALPDLKTEAEERTFWKTHDAIDYLDLSKVQRVTFANLKPSTHSIALRLPPTCSKATRTPPTNATCRSGR